jgi:uncharacterized membrane protein YidH (DUF202 family)
MKNYSKVVLGILLVLIAVQAATAAPTVQELDMNDAVTASDAGAGDLEGKEVLLIVAIIFAVIGLIVVLALI